MKYYYNGELVRTSKNENYNYYCPQTKTCSKTKDGALKDAKYNLNQCKRELAYFKEVLKKLEKGINTKCCITSRNYTFEEVQKYIKNYEDNLEWFANVEVVELEKRA